MNVQGSRPCPRAAHAGTTYASKGYVFGGRFQVSTWNVPKLYLCDMFCSIGRIGE